MIQQVLNKQLLLDVLNSMQTTAVAKDDDRRGRRDGPDKLSLEEQSELLEAIEQARNFQDPREISAGEQPGQPPASEKVLKLRESAPRNTYIAASPEISNLQAAIEQYFDEKRPDAVEGPGPDDRRGKSALGAARTISIAPWKDYLSTDQDRRLGRAFEQTDIRWISAWFAKGVRAFRKRHEFINRPVRTEPISLNSEDKLRIIVFGDWGSGIPRAKKVAKLIREHLDEGIQQGLEQHVIHLGDVYYAGWAYEYKKRFLNDWPVALTEKDTIGSFNLNGNHDMYSGGHDYYNVALADPRFAAWQGKSSLFHLVNKKWQIFGLDTSHEDASLKDDQASWLSGAIDPGRKTILLSHHQYCSSFEKAPQGLIDKIDPVLKDHPITAWLWGHEHRCMTYKNVPNIAFPRCLGHGGVPVYQIHDIGGPTPTPGDWEYRDFVDGGLELWAKFGFVVLDFHGDKIEVRYINEDGGKPDRKETIL